MTDIINNYFDCGYEVIQYLAVTAEESFPKMLEAILNITNKDTFKVNSKDNLVIIKNLNSNESFFTRFDLKELEAYSSDSSFSNKYRVMTTAILSIEII